MRFFCFLALANTAKDKSERGIFQDVVGYFVEIKQEYRGIMERIGGYHLFSVKDRSFVYFRDKRFKNYRKMILHEEPDKLGKIQLFGDIGFIPGNQYHILNNGQQGGIYGEDLNISGAWKMGITGNDVHITITDTGCHHFHQDLIENFDLNRSWSFHPDCYSKRSNSSYCYQVIPNMSEPFSFHGTSCAGIVAGKLNGICGSGIAYNAKFSCFQIRTFPYVEMRPLIESLSRNTNTQIKSNSWGHVCYHNTELDYYMCPQSRRSIVLQNALMKATSEGRNGLGTIVVFAAGNEGYLGDDTSFKMMPEERFVIAVGATNNRGVRAIYSTRGTALLVNAPSGGFGFSYKMFKSFPGIPTTRGPDNDQCTKNFTGTSAACPMVSGVVALILESNPKLTWRDVQFILAITATKNHPECPSWVTNAAGFSHSYFYGFGRTNAGLAVQKSVNWINIPEQTELSFAIQSEIEIPGFHSKPLKIEFLMNDGILFIETVEIEYSLTTNIFGMLRIYLESPSGTRSYLKHPSVHLDVEYNQKKFVMTRGFFGEASQGTWTLFVEMLGMAPSSSIRFATLSIFGTKQSIPTNNEKTFGVLTKMRYNVSNFLNVSRIPKIIQCGADFSISIQFHNIDANTPIIISIIDIHKGITFQLKESILSKNIKNLKAPCIFQDTNSFYIEVYLPEYQISDMKQINIVNTAVVEDIISPIHNQIIRINDLNRISFDLVWNMKMTEIPPSIWDQKVIVTVFNEENNEVILTKVFINNGSAKINANNISSCHNCILVITPTYHSNYSVCTPLFRKISIIKKHENMKLKPISFNNSYCSNQIVYRSKLNEDEYETLISTQIAFITFVVALYFILRKYFYKCFANNKRRMDEVYLLRNSVLL